MRKLATCVTGLLIVALVLGAIGCGGGMSTADLVKWLPVGYEAYMSVDIKAVRQDPDLAPLSQSLQMAEYTEFGIDVSEVDYVAMAVRGDDDALMLLIGKVDREWMRLRLSGLGFEEGKYQGAEIWTRSGIGRPSMGFALMDDKTVIGRTLDGTRQCIRALKGVGGSAYENRDLKDVVERLPKGIVVMGALSGELMEDLPECLAIAASFQPAVGETLRATFVAKFPDEAAAERGRPAFEEDPDMFDVEVVRDGRFLEATAIMPLSELGQVGSAQTTTPTPTPKPPATIRSTALPNAPTNLGAEAMASGWIDLSWWDNSATEAGFKIMRRAKDGIYRQIAKVGADVNEYSDIGLTESTRYYYQVLAYNDAGASGLSNEVSATNSSLV